MAIVTEIASCQRCGKLQSKQKLLQAHDLWGSKLLCKSCYQKHQRSQWGYW
ncbi:MAG TPA: hypothetical protein GXZ50_09555 [Clostridia bacterium]|nr:hypothetical protein [Clostridia bacterium]